MMIRLTGLTAAIALTLVGCTKEAPSEPQANAPIGSDRDEHGCIASAGYSWCAATDSCERPWELAEEQEFENTPEKFSEFCSG